MKCAHYAFVNIIAVTVATNQTNFVTPSQTTDTTGQAGESLTRQNGKAFLESLLFKMKDWTEVSFQNKPEKKNPTQIFEPVCSEYDRRTAFIS